jgi:hypothetical protein
MVDPQVTQSLSDMIAALAKANTIVFTATSTTEDASSMLEKLQFDTTVHGTIQRPNLVYVEKTGAENVTIWFDGANVTVLDRTANTYLQAPVNGDIDDLLATLDGLQVEAPFGGLLRSDLLQKVADYVYQGDYYAQTVIDDHPVNHLAMRQENVDWQLWTDTDTSLPRKVVITSKMLNGAPDNQFLVRDVKVNTPIDASIFKAALPAGASAVSATP